MLPQLNLSHLPPLGPLADYMLPRLSPLNSDLTAASFEVMKLLPAFHILNDAWQKGELTAESEVIESTSGTFGLALALLRPYFGFGLTIVSDPVLDPMMRMRLKALGANVEIVTETVNGAYQLARLKRVEECMQKAAKPFFTNQYHNPLNAEGYAPCGEYIVEKLGQIDLLVGSVGTGGSVCGIGRALKAANPNLRVVGVDTHCSVIFGQPPGARRLRGLGNSLIPENVDHQLFDEVHWVSADEAFAATRELHRRYSHFRGGTSGAAWMVADWVSRTMPGAKALVLLPDDGNRYLELIYNEDDPDKDRALLANGPYALNAPDDVADSWCYYPWNRAPLSGFLQAA